MTNEQKFGLIIVGVAIAGGIYLYTRKPAAVAANATATPQSAVNGTTSPNTSKADSGLIPPWYAVNSGMAPVVVNTGYKWIDHPEDYEAQGQWAIIYLKQKGFWNEFTQLTPSSSPCVGCTVPNNYEMAVNYAIAKGMPVPTFAPTIYTPM